MPIIDRIKRITKASVNGALSRTRDPEKRLEQEVRELEEGVNESKRSVTDFATTLKKREKELEQLKRVTAEWQHKAETALRQGEEQTAKAALSEKVKSEQRAQTLEPSVADSRRVYRGLHASQRELQDNLDTTRLRLAELTSRKRSADAQQAFGKATAPVRSESTARTSLPQ